MPIITVSNHKGGVGKTTSALNLGAALQDLGKRVLLVDFDPQGSLTVATGILDVDAVPLSIGDLLVAHAGGTPLNVMDAIVHSPCGLDLVPGNGMLCAAELMFGDSIDYVQMDLAAAATEALRGPGEHGIAAAGQVPGV